MAWNESKEGKQGVNMNVPELEHNRPNMVKNRSSDTQIVRQQREALTALRNEVNTRGRHTGKACAWRGHLPISKDRQLRHLASRYNLFFHILKTALVIYSWNDIQCHFPSSMKSPPESAKCGEPHIVTGECDWPKSHLILQSRPEDPETELQLQWPSHKTPFLLCVFKKKKKKKKNGCYKNTPSPNKYVRKISRELSHLVCWELPDTVILLLGGAYKYKHTPSDCLFAFISG